MDKRLTEHNKTGIWSLKGIEWDLFKIGRPITKDMNEKLYGALCKLKDYEDTGLSPEDVVRVNNFGQSQAGKLLKKLNKVEKDLLEERRKHEWIPSEHEVPVDGRYVLLSFANFSGLLIGRYEQYEDGSGNWYLGDCDDEDTCLANDLIVSAWMPLPKPYDEETM